MSNATRISRRERVLIVGFAFFAELVLGYALLIDPDLTRLQRIDQQAVNAQKAIAALEAAAGSPVAVADARVPVPPVLPAVPGESFDLATERFLDTQVAQAGAVPLSIALPTPNPEHSPSAYRRARLSASGSYKSVAELVSRLGRPTYRIGLESLTVKSDPEDGAKLRADLDLFVEPPVAAAPTPGPQPASR